MSIRQNLLEEAYEVCEGIDRDDPAILREELGDLFLQVVFHVCIEEERGRFDFGDVLTELAEKLIRRHPNLFAKDAGGAAPSTAGEMLDEWDRVKRQEKGGHRAAVAAVAKSLPGLMRAEKLQGRAAKAGVVPPSPQEASALLAESAGALAGASDETFERALGELLFRAAGLARLRGADAELALERECDRFAERFAEEHPEHPDRP